MILVLRNSEQLYNYSVYYERINICLLATKTETTRRTIKKDRLCNVAWFTNRTIQTLWKIQLSLLRRQRTRSCLLPISQHAWSKAYNDLCPQQLEITGRTSIRELSKSAAVDRRNKQHQPRVIFSKGCILKRCHQKWKKPP